MCTDKQELHPLQKETPKLCDIIWWKECHWLVALETWLCRMLQEQDHENGEMSHSLLWSSSEKMYRQGQPRWVSHFDLCVTHSCVDYTTCLKSWNHFLCCLLISFYLSLGDIDEICKQNPKAILRKKDNCAQYYNCSVSNSSYGGHLQECKYPDLFSTVSMECENFKTVTCDNRTEPQAPCEFWRIWGQVFEWFYN